MVICGVWHSHLPQEETTALYTPVLNVAFEFLFPRFQHFLLLSHFYILLVCHFISCSKGFSFPLLFPRLTAAYSSPTLSPLSVVIFLHNTPSTAPHCVVSVVCQWEALWAQEERPMSHTHTHTRWEPLAWPFPPLPSLYQHSHTNKLICTGAPSNRLLSFVAHMPASAHARCAHTLISTTRPLSSPLQTWHNLRHKFYYFKKGHGQFSYFAVPERSFMATG